MIHVRKPVLPDEVHGGTCLPPPDRPDARAQLLRHAHLGQAQLTPEGLEVKGLGGGEHQPTIRVCLPYRIMSLTASLILRQSLTLLQRIMWFITR